MKNEGMDGRELYLISSVKVIIPNGVSSYTLSNRRREGKFSTEDFHGGHHNLWRGAPVGFFSARILHLMGKKPPRTSWS